jgi:hypothetical protein
LRRSAPTASLGVIPVHGHGTDVEEVAPVTIAVRVDFASAHPLSR